MIIKDDNMKHIFIGYSNKDKIVARCIYRHLTRRNWSNVEIFMDEFSIKPSENWRDKCLKQAGIADLGVIVLSEYTRKSEYVPEEEGFLKGRGIPVIYVALHEEWKIPSGYGKTIKSFPLYESKNPTVGFDDLTELIANTLNTCLAKMCHLHF